MLTLAVVVVDDDDHDDDHDDDDEDDEDELQVKQHEFRLELIMQGLFDQLYQQHYTFGSSLNIAS